MKNIPVNFKKNALPHLLIIASFIALSFAYFHPQLQSKRMAQHDVEQYQAMSQELRSYQEETGEHSNWTTSMFSGMPAYQIRPHYPNRLFILENLYDLIVSPIDRPASFMFTYLLGFYIMMLCFKVGPMLSFVGAIAFAFSTYNIIIIEAGHNTKAIAMGLAPLVIGGLYAAYRTPYWLLAAALTGMFLGFQIRANHVQITYYLMFIVLAMGIAELFRAYYQDYLKQFFKTSAALLVAALLGIGAGITNLLMTWEYGEDTIRGPSALEQNDGEGDGGSGLDPDYAFNWSYGITETGNLLIPNFKGGASASDIGTNSETYSFLTNMGVPANQAERFVRQMPSYWGDQPMTSGPVYLGAIVCFLFVLSLFWLKGPLKWGLLTVSVIAVMLAWGKNFPSFNYFFFDYFPLYDRFRAVTMILFIPILVFPLMGMLAVAKYLNNKVSQEDFMEGLKWSLGITGGFCLIFAVMPGVFFNFINQSADAQLANQVGTEEIKNALRADRQSMLQTDAWRSLFFILVGAGALYFRNTGHIKNHLTIGIIAAATLIDLWAVDRRYLNEDDFVSEQDFEQIFEPTPADQRILADDDPNFRVLDLTSSPFNSASASYHHKSVGGYHGAKMGRYQDLIDHRLGSEVQQLQQQLQQTGQPGNLQNFSMLNMLNTRYLILGEQENQVMENPNALGNAWFVENIEWTATAQEAMNRLGEINPAETAVIEETHRDVLDNLDPSPGSGDLIQLTDFKPDYLEFETSAGSPQLAVISEVYYNDGKGWKAYINGERAEHVRVNYVLRGIEIPEGEHTIEFKFEPDTYYFGERISLISSLLLLFFILGSMGYHFRLHKYLKSN